MVLEIFQSMWEINFGTHYISGYVWFEYYVMKIWMNK